MATTGLRSFASGLAGIQGARDRKDQEDYNERRLGLLEATDKREQAAADLEAKQAEYNKLYTSGRDNEWIMLGAGKGGEGGVGLTDKLKQSMTDAGSNAQKFAIANINAGGASKFPPGFQVTDLEAKGTNEKGEELFAARGNYNGDPKAFGALTVTGSNDPDAEVKLFTRDELFEQLQQSFRTTDGGVLYGQTVVDINSLSNSRDLINAYNSDQITDKAKELGGPELQREVSSIIVSTRDPEAKGELIEKLADDFQVETVSEVPKQPSQATTDDYDDFVSGAPTESESTESDPDVETSSSDNEKPVMESPATMESQTSTNRVAQLEKEIEDIENRKTGSRRANVKLAQKKRAELERLREQSEPERPTNLSGRNAKFASTPATPEEAMPPIVEQNVAPALEGKTTEEIDKVVDEGGINASPEVIAEAAEDLQKEGIQSAADLAKLPLRKQLFAYALITASTPIGTERNAVRNQMLNVLETGISDRGKSIVDAQKAQTAAGRLGFDIRNNQDKLLKEGTDAAVRVNKALVNAVYKDEDGQATFAQLTTPKANEIANTIFPTAMAEYEGFMLRGQTAAAEALRPQMNAAISFVVQGLIKDGNETLLDSFLTFFNPEPQGQFNGDLSNIFLQDVRKNKKGEIIGGDIVYYEGNRETGDRIDVSRLQAINDNLAKMVLDAAASNTERRLKQSRRDA